MEIVRIKIYTPFRGLKPPFEIRFKSNSDRNEIDPVCFAGLNGAGKSNVMELISEIFFYLEAIHHLSAQKYVKRNSPFGFYIEYRLPVTANNLLEGEPSSYISEGLQRTVYIDKKKEKGPEISYQVEGYDEVALNPKSSSGEEYLSIYDKLLPAKIVAYSSGGNEQISKPFRRMGFFYFDEFERATHDAENIGNTRLNRLYFMDYRSNAAVLLADFIFKEYDVVVLKSIVDTLADIGGKAEELNLAFRSSNVISRKLLDFLATPEGENYGTEINEVVSYFKEVRDNLGIISRKINGLRPRLNEYVRDINRHDFYKKCKKFVNYVLTQSEVVKGEVCLPDGIPKFRLKPERGMKFVIIKENPDLGGSVPRQAKGVAPEVTEDIREANYQKDLVAQQKRQRIAGYLKELQHQLDRAKEVDFSEFFHRIVVLEKGDLNLTIKWASKALTKYNLDNLYRVEIAQEKIVNSEYLWISIWKTVIYKRR